MTMKAMACQSHRSNSSPSATPIRTPTDHKSARVSLSIIIPCLEEAQGIVGTLVTRSLFEASGGFPEIALMEDIAMSKPLKQSGPPLCLSHRLTTSRRRWEKHGVLRTIFLMWGLRLAYWLGADPNKLALYYACR